MITKILILLAVLFVMFLLLVVYSCCVISGRCSEIERKMEYAKRNYK